MIKRIAFFVNSLMLGKQKTLTALHQTFENHLHDIFESQYPQHTIKLVADAVSSQRYSHFIIIGGDGSMNEGLNGLLQGVRLSEDLSVGVEQRYDWSALQKLVVGLYPAGTGNDFARSIAAKPNFQYILDCIEQNKIRAIDIGYALFNNVENYRSERFFMNITDVGMGGAVAVKISQKSRWLSSKMFYNKAIIQTFLTYKKQNMLCYSEKEKIWEGKAMSIIGANANYFGGGLGIAPDVQLDSGMMQVVVLGNIDLWDYLINLPVVMKKRHIKHPQVFYHIVPEIIITPVDEDLPIDMDGEFVGYAPLLLRKLYRKLNFLTTLTP